MGMVATTFEKRKNAISLTAEYSWKNILRRENPNEKTHPMNN